MPALPSMPMAAGWGLTGVVVGVSGLMSVMYGYSLGEASGLGLVFAALAGGITGVKAMGLALTFGRGHRLAGLYVLPLVALAFCYAVTAGHQFAAENLSRAANKVEGSNTAYVALRDSIEGMRGDLKVIAEARDVNAIKAEIARLLLDPRADGCSGAINGPITGKVCPVVGELRTAQALAERRDGLRVAISDAVLKLQASPSSAGASRDAGPVAAMAGRVTGYDFGSQAEFMAWLIVCFVELGDIVLPLVMTMVAQPSPRRTREARMIEVEKVIAVQAVAAQGKTAKEIKRERDISECQTYLDTHTTRDQGAKVTATDFHHHYSQVCASEGRPALKLAEFGQIMGREMKLTKIKRNSWHYMGIKLKPLPAPKLRAVA